MHPGLMVNRQKVTRGREIGESIDHACAAELQFVTARDPEANIKVRILTNSIHRKSLVVIIVNRE